MQLITDAEVTVVAITSIFVLLSQFAYFVQIGYSIWRDRNQPLVGNHTYAILRAFLSTYRYSFGFWGLCTASEIASLIGVGILKNNNQPLAYQCFLYCKVIKVTSCIFFLNKTVLFPARKSWTGTRWRGKSGEIIYYTSAALQSIILLVAIITSVLWLTTTEARPLLCIWAIPFPAYLAYAFLATRATLQIDSATRFPIKGRIYSWAVVSWTAFVVLTVVLGLALKSPLSTFHLACYSTQCSFSGVLLVENCVWKWWRRRYPNEQPRSLTSVSPRGYRRNPDPSVPVGRHTSRDFEHSSATLIPTVRWHSSSTSTSLGYDGLAAAVTPQIRNAIWREHGIFCQIEPKLFRAPIEPQLVLDVGSGPGAWARSMIEKYPDMKITTTDIIPTLYPESSRITHFVDNANHPWTFRHSMFDLVHIRGLSGCVGDWLHLFQSAHCSLREGGYIEFCDITLPKLSETGQWPRSSQAARQIAQEEGHSFEILDSEGDIRLQPEKVRSELEDPGTQPSVEVVRVIGQKCTEQSPNDVHGLDQEQELKRAEGWTRHTRVYGGGVCLCCVAAERGNGKGGYYGENVAAEEKSCYGNNVSAEERS
uniref:Methyltransferase domain-containing protein n=1 Tax=Bionectria ochroleuca TaxID=29856 RepID=A0A0B7KR31_BIOOC